MCSLGVSSQILRVWIAGLTASFLSFGMGPQLPSGLTPPPGVLPAGPRPVLSYQLRKLVFGFIQASRRGHLQVHRLFHLEGLSDPHKPQPPIVKGLLWLQTWPVANTANDTFCVRLQHLLTKVFSLSLFFFFLEQNPAKSPFHHNS